MGLMWEVVHLKLAKWCQPAVEPLLLQEMQVAEVSTFSNLPPQSTRVFSPNNDSVWPNVPKMGYIGIGTRVKIKSEHFERENYSGHLEEAGEWSSQTLHSLWTPPHSAGCCRYIHLQWLSGLDMLIHVKTKTCPFLAPTGRALYAMMHRHPLRYTITTSTTSHLQQFNV